MKASSAEIRQCVLQVDMGFCVVSISRQFETATGVGKPIFNGDSKAKCRQFEQGDVEGPTVKTYQCRMLIVGPAAPKKIGDHVRLEGGIVQHRQVDELAAFVYLGHDNRNRKLECIRYKVGIFFRHQLIAKASNRGLGR